MGLECQPQQKRKNMARMNDERGCSNCKVVGTENYQRYTACNKKRYYQYDYRHTDGELFTCVAPTLEACRVKRSRWIEMLNNK